VIAVGTALFNPGNDAGSVGLGLAIPANDVVSVINQLWAGGHDRIGWIGARVQGLTGDIAAALGLPTTAGSIVLAARHDGPAAQAGLSEGDVILKVGDADAPTPRILNRMNCRQPHWQHGLTDRMARRRGAGGSGHGARTAGRATGRKAVGGGRAAPDPSA
jgi:hypothetical protein